ncbi:hypothetical protein E4P42_03495 [Mycobacterium sp. PS03-16]|uniref:Rv0361 family membrane protein n=1 Tax=Mycobacterium sp. PS03-16 TaxID=2559611 RepID=UPI0010731E7C|nr:hypothetical protein [Mycobacterium sp. PS03-16]TFV60570.1 hypothetical protein E4P42_03495 [Mycobacterium sp. PS03-16]
MAGPYPYPESYPQHPLPPHQAQQPPPHPYPAVPSPYPGMMPPPMPYPKRNRKKLVFGTLAVLAILAVVATVLVVTFSGGERDSGGPLSDQAARTAIQNYLDALADGDDETVARNTLCGLYDDVKEKRSDLALAGLAGDAFRKQFSRAEVTSIDTIVQWSPNQAQVLFTMRVAPAGGSTRGQEPPDEEEQAIAQLLIQGDDVLVCSYLLRSGGQY